MCHVSLQAKRACIGWSQRIHFFGRNLFSTSFIYRCFCKCRSKFVVKGISVKMCGFLRREFLASQGCKRFLSCQGTIATCAAGCPSFIHRSCFLPSWFIHTAIVSPFFHKQQNVWGTGTRHDLTRCLNEFFYRAIDDAVQQKCCLKAVILARLRVINDVKFHLFCITI